LLGQQKFIGALFRSGSSFKFNFILREALLRGFPGIIVHLSNQNITPAFIVQKSNPKRRCYFAPACFACFARLILNAVIDSKLTGGTVRSKHAVKSGSKCRSKNLHSNQKTGSTYTASNIINNRPSSDDFLILGSSDAAKELGTLVV